MLAVSSCSCGETGVRCVYVAVPDREVIGAMREREMELCHSKLFQRAYSLLCADRANIIHHVQLRVVREFGLPDSTVQVLQSSAAGVLSPPADHRQSSGASACHDLAVTVGTGSGTCRLMTVGGVPSNRHWQHVLVQSHHCPLDAGRHSPLVAPIGQRLPFEVNSRHTVKLKRMTFVWNVRWLGAYLPLCRYVVYAGCGWVLICLSVVM